MAQRCIRCRRARKTKQGLCGACRPREKDKAFNKEFDNMATGVMKDLGLNKKESEKMLAEIS